MNTFTYLCKNAQRTPAISVFSPIYLSQSIYDPDYSSNMDILDPDSFYETIKFLRDINNLLFLSYKLDKASIEQSSIHSHSINSTPSLCTATENRGWQIGNGWRCKSQTRVEATSGYLIIDEYFMFNNPFQIRRSIYVESNDSYYWVYTANTRGVRISIQLHSEF